MPKAIIFDFDGLILDTEVPVYEAWRENYEAFGQVLPIEVYSGCVGSDFGGFDPKAHLESLIGSEIDWDFWDERRSTDALNRTRQLEPFSGVQELLHSARSENIPCVVASSSPRSWVEGHLERLGLLSHFSTTRCLDDVERPKPAPDLFLAAVRSVDVLPEEAIVLEDSLNGLLAARAAGIPCVVVPNRITSHLSFEGAAEVLSTLEGIDVPRLTEIRTQYQERRE